MILQSREAIKNKMKIAIFSLGESILLLSAEKRNERSSNHGLILLIKLLISVPRQEISFSRVKCEPSGTNFVLSMCGSCYSMRQCFLNCAILQALEG